MDDPGKSAAQTQPRPDPNQKLVKVFDSEEESEVMIVKGLLDSNDIDNDMTAASLVQDMFPGLGGMIILVRQEDADRARQLIADYRQSPTSSEDSQDDDEEEEDDDATAELDISGEPPAKA